MSARGALLQAHASLITPADRFEYPALSWVQGSGFDLHSDDGEGGEGGAAGRGAVVDALAGVSRGTLFDAMTGLQSSPPPAGKEGGAKDVPPSPAAFPFSG